jgi:hypothetical protein
MTITETPNGWQVEPSTSDERKCLSMLFQALKETYAGVSATEVDSPQASHSLPLAHSQNKVA